MGNCCGPSDTSSSEMRERHREIERQIREDKKTLARLRTVTLVGPASTGKSTFIKQLQLQLLPDPSALVQSQAVLRKKIHYDLVATVGYLLTKKQLCFIAPPKDDSPPKSPQTQMEVNDEECASDNEPSDNEPPPTTCCFGGSERKSTRKTTTPNPSHKSPDQPQPAKDPEPEPIKDPDPEPMKDPEPEPIKDPDSEPNKNPDFTDSDPKPDSAAPSGLDPDDERLKQRFNEVYEDLEEDPTLILEDLLLWKKKEGKMEKLRRSLLEHVFYFFQQDRVFNPDFEVTLEDYLHLRIASQTARQISLPHQKEKIHFVDAGGLRSVRKCVMPYLENTRILVFFQGSIDYALTLQEAPSVNRMHEAICMWNELNQNRSLAHTELLFIFTKVDLLEQQLKYRPISDYFPEGPLGSDLEEAKEFLRTKFASLVKDDRPCDFLFLDLTSPDFVSSILVCFFS